MLHVHRSQRADRLAEALAELLTEPPDDPFTPDIVAVPAKGVERWLAQRLSHVLGATSGDAAEAGVCAHVLFPPPGALIGEVLSAVTGVPAQDDPWRSDRLPWPLLAVLDACAGQPWCEVLERHLEQAAGRRLATAQHLAALFAGYAAARPTMITAWVPAMTPTGRAGHCRTICAGSQNYGAGSASASTSPARRNASTPPVRCCMRRRKASTCRRAFHFSDRPG